MAVAANCALMCAPMMISGGGRPKRQGQGLSSSLGAYRQKKESRPLSPRRLISGSQQPFTCKQILHQTLTPVYQSSYKTLLPSQIPHHCREKTAFGVQPGFL
jgi:hypothetical protein